MSLVWLLTVGLVATRTTESKQIKKEKKAASHDIFANAAEKITRGQLR